MKQRTQESVHPEDKALLGSNLSAAMDPKTAGRGGGSPSWHACLRDRPQCEKSRAKGKTKTNWISILAVSPKSDIHAEPVQDLHHDWGFVLTVFREFLFLGARPDMITRFVIGYD